MFRTARRICHVKNLASRTASTTNAAPVPPKKGGVGGLFPLVVLVNAGIVVYAAYRAETDPDFAVAVAKVPGSNYLLDPFRSAIVSTGLISKSPSVQTKAPEAAAVETPVANTKPPAEEPKVDTHKVDESSHKHVEEVEQKMDHAQESSQPEVSIEEEALEKAAQDEDNVESKVETKSEPTVAAPVKAEPEVQDKPVIKSVTIPTMPSEELAKATDSKVLKQALADSAREFIALRRDVESTLLKDIHTLDEHALRVRIKQLASEMFERLAWEDLRMNQSLKGVQAELSEKYTDLMNRQRNELELEVRKILFNFEQDSANKSASKLKEVESTYQKQLEDTIRAQAEGFHSTLKKELEEQNAKITAEYQDELNHQVALLRKGQVDQLMELQPQIQGVYSQLEGVRKAANATAAAIKQTIDIHQLSAAVLSLELALSSTVHYSDNDHFISQQFAAVKSACEGDEVVTAVLDALPARVVAKGALPLSELQVRFAVMREEVRKTALAPEAAPKMVGQLIGTFLASISSAPTGLISGPGAEEALSRAAYYLERGRLSDTLKELDGVQGYAQVLMKDWKALAQERLVVDQSIRVLKANAVIRHKAFK